MSESNPFKIFQEAYDAYQIKSANIMVLGKSGVGKSTLINSFFRDSLAETGIGSPVTKNIKRFSKKDVPVAIYDTPGLELNGVTQQKLSEEIQDLIQKAAKGPDDSERMHLLWYCINANANRIEQFEIDWIKELSQKVAVVIVLTQSHGKDSMTFKKYIDSLNLDVANVCRVLAFPYESSSGLIEPAFGLKTLAQVSFECLPEAYRIAFVNAQMVDIDRKVAMTNKAVIGYCATAFATGFVPLPMADSLMLVPEQIAMMAHITKMFGLPADKAFLSYLVATVTGTSGATVVGKIVAGNLLKLIPVVGTSIGGTVSGSTAAVITGALGFGYIQVLAKIAEGINRGEKYSNEQIVTIVKTTFASKLADKSFIKHLINQLKPKMKIDPALERKINSEVKQLDQGSNSGWRWGK